MNYWRDALISGAAPHFAALIAISFISSWVSFRREIIIITTSLSTKIELTFIEVQLFRMPAIADFKSWAADHASERWPFQHLFD